MFFTPRQVLVRLRYADPLTRIGIAAALRQESDFKVLVEMDDADMADGRPDEASPIEDVLVADYEHGIEAAACARVLGPYARTPKVLVITARETEAEIRRALGAGVRGYLLLGCRATELVVAVRSVERGQRPLGELVAMRVAESLLHDELTGRELDVLELLARGYPNKAISSTLDISIGTVKTHVRGIMLKLQASSRTEATVVAERRGLLASRDVAIQRRFSTARRSGGETRIGADSVAEGVSP